MKEIKTIGVLTSGGDAPGMNAAIRAVTRSAIYNGWKVFGIYRGYEGLIHGDFKELTTESVSNTIQRGGTILKTARSEEFMTAEGRKKSYDNLVEYGVDALIVIGGNGSLAGAQDFAREYDIPVIGLPGTIDNDLYGTDSTIGYDTALNTIMECVDKIRDTASSHERLFFIEVMGRDAGFLALNGAIASGAEEYPEGCIEAMQKNFKTIAVSASDIAIQLGNPKCMNVVLFGAMCDSLGCPEIDWEQIVAETVPAKVKELNLKAFRAGRAAAQGAK